MKGFTLIALLALTSSCASGTNNKFERASIAKTAQTQMIGMTRHDVLACAGVPMRETRDGGTDFMTYAAGGDSVSAGAVASNGSLGTAVVASKTAIVK